MSESLSRSFPWGGVFAIALSVFAGLAYWLWFYEPRAEPKPEIVAISPVPEPIVEAESTAPDPVEEPAEIEPVDFVDPVPPLPRLNQSDAELKSDTRGLSGGNALLEVLVNDEIIRKSVRMVHGLSEGFVVKEFRPVQSPAGLFKVVDTGVRNEEGAPYYRLDESNSERYAKYFKVLALLEPTAAADLYQKYYPLMQEAYEELGLPEKRFHKVMLDALDSLLLPVNKGSSLNMRQPSVMYVFDDPAIESSSNINRLKIRLGDRYSDELEAWVSRFRHELKAKNMDDAL